MSRYRIYAFMVAVSVAFAYPALVFAQDCNTEPVMSNYTSTPIFITQAVKPNVMIILDNSGSMNYPAYGTWPAGEAGPITLAPDDYPYTGSPPFCGVANVRVVQAKDDAEENVESSSAAYYSNNDLDLGGFGDGTFHSLVGLRFQNVVIPQGATVTEAYITLTANAPDTSAFNYTIRGEAADDTRQFENAVRNISDRPDTAASETWSGTTAWVTGSTYSTVDLKRIVQEIVNRPGWHDGNSMVFKISGTGKRDAKAYDGSPNRAAILHVWFTSTPNTCARYYGYFDPDSQYTYNGNSFVRDPAGPWNGNFMNWLSMRRIDVARKVIMGGFATSRTGTGNQTLIGDDHNLQPTRYWKRIFNRLTAVNLTPYAGDVTYGIRDGYIYVDLNGDGDPFSSSDYKMAIKVVKDWSTEPEAFDSEKNLAGVLQKVGANKARWGLSFFNDGAAEGGYVSIYVGDSNLTNMVTAIQNKKGATWTPQAEGLFEVARYFQQLSPYYQNADYTTGANKDPFYWGVQAGYVPCSKNFVLLLTDGESTQDLNIPDSLKNYAAGYKMSPAQVFPDNGTDYLPDVALWARTTDLRPGETPPGLPGEQNLILYVVNAFGRGSQLLQDAAKNGGFEDRNGNKRPDLVSEYDKNGDGFPDTYYESDDGYQLERELIRAINDILERAASGTAVSVLATSGEGEGNVVQAYFLPVVKTLDYDVTWIGHLQSLWVDSHGNLREDSDGDLALDVTKDMVVEYVVSSTGDARIRRYQVSGTSPYPTYSSENLEGEIPLDEVRPLWEAGKLLHLRNPDTRRIFTFIDKNKNGFVDDSGNVDDDTGEVVRFDYGTDAVNNIKPYLGVRDYTYWKYLGSLHDDRARNLIMYIRGMEPGYSGSASFTGTGTLQTRTRVLDGHVWKLGDIVHSTPVSVAKPADNYNIIYGDESYQTYYDAVKDRETAVYVGANDGMLHAFTSWKYNSASKQYVKPAGAPSEEQIGDELWAYIPQAVLPHLKWIPHTDYGHVYYVDLKPKIFDAKIIPNGTHYTDSSLGLGEKAWGTIMIGGLNFGGRQICVKDTFDNGSGVSTFETRTYNPVYFCMDVTNPRQPRLLWEREFVDLNMSQSTPAIIRVNDKWLAVFGSGTTDYDGNCTTKGRVYVVDLETGRSIGNPGVFTSTTTNGWLFETVENNAFINGPVSFDKDLDYNVDAVYLGSSYYDTVAAKWKGRAYKIAIQWDWANQQPYDDGWNPNGTHPWKWVRLFDTEGPITAPMSLSLDSDDKVWVYMGTGRYISEADKTNADTQYIIGLKDPFFDTFYDGANGNYYHSYVDYSNASPQVSQANLLDATPYVVRTDANVFLGGTLFREWNQFVNWVGENYRGWYRTLDTRERVLSKYAILGGVLFAPTFVPNQDICGYGGDSWLYGLYYETGTSYYKPAFKPTGTTNDDVLVRVFLGAGLASAAGIHVGQEAGARAFIQQSTGVISQQELSPAFTIKSGLINWRQK